MYLPQGYLFTFHSTNNKRIFLYIVSTFKASSGEIQTCIYLIGKLLGEYHKNKTVKSINIYISAYQAILRSYMKLRNTISWRWPNKPKYIYWVILLFYFLYTRLEVPLLSIYKTVFLFYSITPETYRLVYEITYVKLVNFYCLLLIVYFLSWRCLNCAKYKYSFYCLFCETPPSIPGVSVMFYLLPSFTSIKFIDQISSENYKGECYWLCTFKQ